MLPLPSDNTLHNTSSHTSLLFLSSLCFCPQDGFTALHLAAQEGKADVVRLLTEAKAHVNTEAKVCKLPNFAQKYA